MADAPPDRSVRTLITPEGVDLQVRIAQRGERAIALVIDLLIMMGALLALTFLTIGALIGAAGREAVAIIWMLGFFVLRNFYFTVFECTHRAATPGKRIMGLRVAMRDGRPVHADAIVARNAMRELELYLPLSFLIVSGSALSGLITLSGLVWCGIFILLPFFNRDGLRAGDIIAGTWVLKTPKHTLLADLADGSSANWLFPFTEQQLDAYGIKELQVLETVLRQKEPQAVQAVAERIRLKIDWRKGPVENDLDFLNAYYRALRQKLERRLLFGVRKRDKFDVKV